MYRVLDHPLAAQVVAEIHGPQLRVDYRTDIGILFRKLLPDGLLPPVGILFLGDQLQNSVTVYDLPVCSDAVRQFRPVFGHPPHGEHRVDASAVSADEVTFERRGPTLRKTVVESVGSLRRRCRRQRDGIDVKLLLFDDLPYQAGDLVQLPPIVVLRIDYAGIAHEELNVVTILYGHELVDDLDTVTRHSIYEGEHRRYDVAQRIRRRQAVGAVVYGQDLPLKRYEYLFRGLIRFHLLRVIVRDGAPAFDQRVEPDVFGIGKLHEAVEGRLAPYGIGTETLDIGFVLPVVALLQQREASAADHQIFERHGLPGLVQNGCNDDAATTA